MVHVFSVGDGKVHADNELWFKYEAQVEVNKKLEREKKHLEYELRQIEEQGVINLDSLSQSELIMYVKQLERTKTDLTSDLRAKEWSLDKQSKVQKNWETESGRKTTISPAAISFSPKSILWRVRWRPSLKLNIGDATTNR